MPLSLDELIGHKITLSLVSSDRHYAVKLRGVENSGLWVEGRTLDALLGHKPSAIKRPKKPIPPLRPVLFIPFSQIVFAVYYSVDLTE